MEKGIAAAVRKLNAYTTDFRYSLQAYSDREMNDSTIAITPVRYNAPKILSGSFIMQAVKTAGPLCALGFMVCLIGIVVSRVKKEKA